MLLPFLRYNQVFSMSVTTFQEKLAANGARLGMYRGAETPANFGDSATEFRALLEGCALLDMSWQAKLVLAGEDRVRWLNGMVTNNVRDLAPGCGVYSFVLNAQGRIQGDLVAYNRGDYLLATTDREQAPAIAEIFDRYIIMDDVEVADISDKLAAIGVDGPKAREILTAAGLDVSQLEPGQVIDAVSRGAHSHKWMDSRSGLPRRTWMQSGTPWSRPAPRPPAAMPSNSIASSEEYRASELIFANAICRRRPDSSTR